MAKRKTLVGTDGRRPRPTGRAEFRSETPAKAGGLVAPIAQIAADSAAAQDPRSASDRAARARAEADAERLRQAEDQGLVIRELPLEDIEADAMVRDRMTLNARKTWRSCRPRSPRMVCGSRSRFSSSPWPAKVGQVRMALATVCFRAIAVCGRCKACAA